MEIFTGLSTNPARCSPNPCPFTAARIFPSVGRMYPYGLIGNCQTSALVHQTGSLDWLCFPRPDSPPVFGKLLDPEGGEFSILSTSNAKFSQRYLANTNVLVTEVRAEDGTFRITDFSPRFEQFGRMYRPNSVYRIVEPVEGSPQIRVRCRPVNGWEKRPVAAVRGNSHLRFDLRSDSLRLTTNMSLTHLVDDIPITLSEKIYFALTWSAGLDDELARTAEDFLGQTVRYWQTWVKHCSIPSSFQKESIRSALALKLHCYEDTGAIMAAMTTSLPEEPGQTRNWDYRLCWLRDSYFTLTAFHNLGHFEEMEGFLRFLLGIVKSDETLRPVYRIDQSSPLPELEHSEWRGFLDGRPVRSNNAAAEQVQNDAFGEMILALTPIFFDERFFQLRTRDHEQLLMHLAKQCANVISLPDAGLWELRGGWQEHSFTNLMCWAGLDRIARLRDRGFFKGVDFDVDKARYSAEQAVRRAVVDGSLRNGPTDPSHNAALLQMPLLRFPDAALNESTVDAITKELRISLEGRSDCHHLYRYKIQDDFGVPQSAFLFCSFWWAQALAKLGRKQEAREILVEVHKAANPLGLFSEHFVPLSGQQLGNFPQAYSHVGQLNAAFAVSDDWDEVL